MFRYANVGFGDGCCRKRPGLEAALEACRQIKAHAPHCRVILTVYEMKRLGRDSAELTALADHLTAHGIALEMLAGVGSPARCVAQSLVYWPPFTLAPRR